MAIDLNTGLQIGMAAVGYPQDYRRRRAEGQGGAQALAGAAGSAFATAALSIPTSLILPLLPAAVVGLYNAAQNSGIQARRIAQPFSTRYEHSDMAGQMQQYALSRMGQMGGFGSEATNYFGRYGRG